MEEKKDRFRWIVVILLFLNIFALYLSINCIPPLFTEITKEITLTKADMGMIMGAPFIAALVFSLIGGGISDRIGSKWALAIAMMMIAVFGTLRSMVGGLYWFVACMFLMGGGLAILGPNIPKVLGMWFASKELATANALCIIGMPIAGAVGMGISAGVLSPALGGWRNVMVASGGCSLVAGIIWVSLYRDVKTEKGTGTKDQSMKENFKKVFKVRDVWWAGIYGFFTMVGTMSVIALLPNTLSDQGVTAAKAGMLVALMLGVSTVFKIVGGMLSDRIGRRKPFLITAAIVQGICTIFFASIAGIPLMIALIIGGIAMGIIPPIFFVIPVEIKEIGPSLAATAMGLILLTTNIGGFIGPIVAGKIMDATGANWAGFAFMGASLIVGGLTFFPIREMGRKNKQ